MKQLHYLTMGIENTEVDTHKRMQTYLIFNVCTYSVSILTIGQKIYYLLCALKLLKTTLKLLLNFRWHASYRLFVLAIILTS